MGVMKASEVNPLYINLARGEIGTMETLPYDSEEREFVEFKVRPIGKGALGLPLRTYTIEGVRSDQMFAVRSYNPRFQALAEPEIYVVFDPTDPNGPIGKYTEKLNQQIRQLKKENSELQLELQTERSKAERAVSGVRKQMASDQSVNSYRRRQAPASLLDEGGF